MSQEAASVPLFASHEPLEFTLSADLQALRGDRRDSPERPGFVSLAGDAGQTLDVQVRTRGHFRLEAANCSLPPLRLNFRKSQLAGTVLDGQDKIKLAVSCRPNRDSYEQLVLNEYLAYRAYEMVSPAAFKVRLVRVTFVDTSGDWDPFTRFGFLIEDDDALAARLGATVFELPEGRTLPPGALDAQSAMTAAVFQYMIGNTDWGDVQGHNIELLDLGGVALPVPFDFDFAGIVHAPYSVPDPSLPVRDVQERLYQGWCWPGMETTPVLNRFRDARDDIMELYTSFPYLEDGERSRMLDYLGVFFDGIDTDEKAERRMFRYCRDFRSTGR